MLSNSFFGVKYRDWVIEIPRGHGNLACGLSLATEESGVFLGTRGSREDKSPCSSIHFEMVVESVIEQFNMRFDNPAASVTSCLIKLNDTHLPKY